MAVGDRVELRGLCSFVVKEYKPYTGRNPRFGGEVKVPAKRLPFFKAGSGTEAAGEWPVTIMQNDRKRFHDGNLRADLQGQDHGGWRRRF